MPTMNVDLPDDLYAAIDEYTGRRAGQLQKREAAIQAWTAWVVIQRRLDQEDDRDRSAVVYQIQSVIDSLAQFATIDQLSLTASVLFALAEHVKIPKGEARRRSA